MTSQLLVDIGGVLGTGRLVTVDDALVAVAPFGGSTVDGPARVSLELRRVDRGIQIDGAIDATVVGPCGRCLEEVAMPLHVDVEERFDPPGGTTDPFAEHNVINGDALDVADLVRQLVTSAIPLGVVCREDCRGLCPSCGRNRTTEPCDCPLPEEIG